MNAVVSSSARAEAVPEDVWRPLRFARRVPEAEGVASFYLEPVDGTPLAPFRAGQYLTLRVPGEGDRFAARTYTISSAPSERRHYRLTVKHERRPEDRHDLPNGLGSSFLHERLTVGGTLGCLAPRGDFVLDASGRPVVLMSGGVGVTPMLSMLAELAAAPAPRRPAWFLHASRDARHHAMAHEARALAARHGAARVAFFHEAGPAEESDIRHGRIDLDALRALLPFDDYSFYLCGPPPFMASLHRGLRRLNVAPDRIAYEFFGPATVLEDPECGRPASAAVVADDAAIKVGAPATTADGLVVRFLRSGVETVVSPNGASLLDLARQAGLDVPFSCEQGICGTCRCRLMSGEVDYASEPIAWREEDEILPCIARPRTAVDVDL